MLLSSPQPTSLSQRALGTFVHFQGKGESFQPGSPARRAQSIPASPFPALPVNLNPPVTLAPRGALGCRNKLIKYAISGQAVSPTGKQRLDSVFVRRSAAKSRSQIPEEGDSLHLHSATITRFSLRKHTTLSKRPNDSILVRFLN